MRFGKYSVLILWLVLACAPAVLIAGAQVQEVREERRPGLVALHGTKVPVAATIGRASGAAALGQRVLILDTKNHQVAARGPGDSWRFVGGIGNGPGEFFYPTEMAMDPATGELAVYDSGNQRIEVFNPDLEVSESSEVNETVLGLAWWTRQRLLLGLPKDMGLLSVRGRSGEDLGTLGELAAPEELSRFEPGVRSTYQKAINRVRVAATREGEVWVSFLHLPLIRIYWSEGDLLLVRVVDLAGLEPLPHFARAVWDLSDRPEAATYLNIDGVQLPVVIKDLAVDSASGGVILLLGSDRLAALDRSGVIRAVGEVTGCGRGFHRLTVNHERGSLLLTSLSRASYCEVPLAELQATGREAGAAGANTGESTMAVPADNTPGFGRTLRKEET